MKSSFHSLTHFLSLFCSRQFRRLDSLQFLCSQAHIPAGWLSKLDSILDCCSVLARVFSLCRFITTRHGPHRKQHCYHGGVITCPLPSNGQTSAARVHCVGMCLPSRCLATDIHVTIYFAFHSCKTFLLRGAHSLLLLTQLCSVRGVCLGKTGPRYFHWGHCKRDAFRYVLGNLWPGSHSRIASAFILASGTNVRALSIIFLTTQGSIFSGV
jgi:hypothetical protein